MLLCSAWAAAAIGRNPGARISVVLQVVPGQAHVLRRDKVLPKCPDLPVRLADGWGISSYSLPLACLPFFLALAIVDISIIDTPDKGAGVW